MPSDAPSSEVPSQPIGYTFVGAVPPPTSGHSDILFFCDAGARKVQERAINWSKGKGVQKYNLQRRRRRDNKREEAWSEQTQLKG
jgi:hypothetical protein